MKLEKSNEKALETNQQQRAITKYLSQWNQNVHCDEISLQNVKFGLLFFWDRRQYFDRKVMGWGTCIVREGGIIKG